ncbi:hypothetical protein LTR08_003491 [Meristemomyces frigidus]|nr:hypothetical protein LTR08_003491 [Meristemomyces frigidus]
MDPQYPGHHGRANAPAAPANAPHIFTSGAMPSPQGPYYSELPPSKAHWCPPPDLDFAYADTPPADLDPAHPTDPAPDSDNDADAGRDPKRRRIARACDPCRRKKIKCDGLAPKCSHCLNYKTECHFSVQEKKRAPPKGAKYIEGLENRLGRMEGLLRKSGLLGDAGVDLREVERRLEERSGGGGGEVEEGVVADARRGGEGRGFEEMDGAMTSPATTNARANLGAISLATTRTATPTPTTPTIIPPPRTKPSEPPPPSLAKAKEKEQEVDALADSMCSLITNSHGETRYIGSSSGFSIFSPQGIQWVNAKTGDSSFEAMINTAAADTSGNPASLKPNNPNTNPHTNHTNHNNNNSSSSSSTNTAHGGGTGSAGWEHWKPEVFADLFTRRVFHPLPPHAECLALLSSYFAHFNQMFPLFHEPTFMHLVALQYTAHPYTGSGWWASLNVALAIAHRLRVTSDFGCEAAEDAKAWGFLKNAMAVMTELTMRNTDLLSIQALLGMALFLQGTPNPQPSFFLVAAAIRLAHSIGLHKRGSGFGLNGVENEQRKRVFWIAYLLDKDICLRSGRPPVLDDDDMNVELPAEEPGDGVGVIVVGEGGGCDDGDKNNNNNNNNNATDRTTTTGNATATANANATKTSPENAPPRPPPRKTLNLFRLNATFAQIQSRVYKNLYSVAASRQSDGSLLATIGDLDAQLEAWKDAIPAPYRPDTSTNLQPAGSNMSGNMSGTPLLLHVVVLHFAYYNCLTTIHRMSVHHGYWTGRLSEYAIMGLNARPLNPRVFMSAALCVNAARTSIGLVRFIPRGDYACVWLILYYPVSALVTLFANILQNPQDARARSDLKLMSSVVDFLAMLAGDVHGGSNGNVRRMLTICAEFDRIAGVVLERAEREMRSGRGKRKGGAGRGGEGVAGLGQKAAERALRDRGVQEAAVQAGLDEGAPLELMQGGAQPGLRLPVATAGLRGSVAGDAAGGGGCPVSWAGSQTLGAAAGAEQGRPSPRQQVPGVGDGWGGPQMQSSAGLWDGPGALAFQGGGVGDGGFGGGFGEGGGVRGATPPLPLLQQQQAQRQQQQQQQQQQSQPPPDFAVPYAGNNNNNNNNNNGVPNTLPPTGPFTANLSSPTANGALDPSGTGSFQQPFVPQDLWQMPMTLEWDWAEGLGLGSFTPGGLFGGEGGFGGFEGGVE